ncbi:hypothetical protein JCM16138_03920 [Thermococcus atlanticus]
MIVLPDTSALVELIRGSKAGKVVLEILENSDVVIVSTLVLAELERNKIDSSVMDAIAENSLVVVLDREIALSLGKVHSQVKKKNKNVSLADCIISETAKRHGAVVLTMDHHFKLLGNAVIIEK